MFKKIKEFLFGREIFIFTLGNDFYPATARQIESFRKELISKGLDNTDFIIWNHTLSFKKTKKV